MRRKLGLFRDNPDDQALIQSLLSVLEQTNMDYSQFFMNLTDYLSSTNNIFSPDDTLSGSMQNWLNLYQQRLSLESVSNPARISLMQQSNPSYILRKHVLDKVIQQAEKLDFFELNRVVDLLNNPFVQQPDTLVDQQSKAESFEPV